MGLMQYDSTILDGLRLYIPNPSRFPQEYEHVTLPALDFEKIKTRICAECSDLELLYPDADVMKIMVDNFGYANELPWQLLYNSCYYKYNPIWNKDGRIERTETEQRDLHISGKSEVNGTQQHSGEGSVTETREENGTHNSDSTVSVSAFNSSEFSDRDRTVRNNTDSISSNGTSSSNSSNSVNSNDSSIFNNDDVGSIERKYSDKETGNIGVTMTQDMLKKERQIAEFSIIKRIVDDFKKEFCLLVY